MVHLTEFAGLFAVCFLAATVLPAQSEILLAGMVLAAHYPAWALVTVATIGNVLGSTANWLLGRLLSRFEGRRWFPVDRKTIAKAEGWYHRWGKWSLLLSWAPFVGDPLTVVAGVLRERLAVFLALVTIAKLGRYIVVAWLANRWVEG
jgi:membrane protein YqaA with SNARE-associated domain